MGQCNQCISRKEPKEPTPHEMGSFIGSFIQSDTNAKEGSEGSDLLDVYHTRTRSTAATDTYKNEYQVRPATAEEFRTTHSDLVVRVGEHFRDKYHIREQIHSGEYKEVSKCIHKITKIQRVALRYLDPLLGQSLINIMKVLNHPNIMRTFEYFEEKKFFEISDYYSGGELLEYMIEQKVLHESTAANLMRQILSAVSYLHANGIMHRHVSPDNFVFEDDERNTLRLIGFSSAAFVEKGEKYTLLKGVPNYTAPEVIKGTYNEKCDEWACGVILYYMLSGTLPFKGKTEKDVYENILIGKFSLEGPEWHGISARAKDLIRKLLEYNPEKRTTAHDALNHSWFNEHRKDSFHTEIVKIMQENALQNVVKFHPKKKVQELFWLFFTDNFILPQNYKHLAEIFLTLDVNHDGRLSKNELRKFIDEKSVDEVANNIDLNNSGTIEYSEFVIAAFPRHELINTEKINMAFKLLDKDQDGYIGVDDMRDTFDPDNSKEIREEVWRELILQADNDQDGLIGIHDFNRVMKDIEKKGL